MGTLLIKARAAAKKAGVKGLSSKDVVADYKKKAKKPGKRTSADGNVYYENRVNRSDRKGTKI